MIHTIFATDAISPTIGQLESETTKWANVFDGDCTTAQAIATASSIVGTRGFIRAKVFRGKWMGKFVQEITA